jgi:hypothetical protein
MSTYIKNVAIVGAGGNCGGFMAKSLLATGKHTVTAISRTGSSNTGDLPEGIKVASIDYDNPSTIVEALKGQDALIITLGVMAPPDTQSKLIQAAADANVPWVLPNEWSPDSADDGLAQDVGLFAVLRKAPELIAKIGKSSYIAVTTGFWYEWSLAIKNAYGFDFANKQVTLFDEGETKIGTSTWPQVGRAVAALMSLSSEELKQFKNKQVYVNSFTLSQKDMLESVLRVTGDKIDDWTVTKEPAKERYTQGIEAMQKGDRGGFVRMMYTRVFYPDGCGDYETNKGVSNEVLGLPKEDLDEATKVAIARSETNPFGYKH